MINKIMQISNGPFHSLRKIENRKKYRNFELNLCEIDLEKFKKIHHRILSFLNEQYISHTEFFLFIYHVSSVAKPSLFTSNIYRIVPFHLSTGLYYDNYIRFFPLLCP